MLVFNSSNLFILFSLMRCRPCWTAPVLIPFINMHLHNRIKYWLIDWLIRFLTWAHVRQPTDWIIGGPTNFYEGMLKFTIVKMHIFYRKNQNIFCELSKLTTYLKTFWKIWGIHDLSKKSWTHWKLIK